MAKIDTIGLLKKAYKKADDTRKSVSKQFSVEAENRRILNYNTKYGTSIPSIDSEWTLKRKKIMKDLKKGK